MPRSIKPVSRALNREEIMALTWENTVSEGARRLRTCLRSLVKSCWVRRSDGARGSVDKAYDDRLRGDTGADRRHGLIPSYAPAGRAAWAAGLGGGAHATVGGRDDRRGIHDVAGRLPQRRPWRVAAVGIAGGGQRGQPGRQRRSRRADSNGPHHRGLAVLLADRRLRAAHAAGPPRRR